MMKIITMVVAIIIPPTAAPAITATLLLLSPTNLHMGSHYVHYYM